MSLNDLVQLFYASMDEMGKFRQVTPDQMPPPFRALLDHVHHMTVTVEQYFGSPVDVRVLETSEFDNQYARKIVLVTQADRRVVQFGIVRLCWDAISEKVARSIRSEQVPLGRILIEHAVMRDVSLDGLWHVEPADELRQLFACGDGPVETYGRTATIRVDGTPAVELLEIVAPLGKQLAPP